MGDPMMDVSLGWEDQETVFTFDFPVESPYTISPILPCVEPVPSIDDVPDLIPDYEPVAQDAIAKLENLVGELLSRVAILEAQLRSQSRGREALEHYVEARLPSPNDLTLDRYETSDGNLDVSVDQTVTLEVGETDGQVIHRVSVGIEGSPTFVPNRLNANLGDQIQFEFHNLNHTLTQSSLDKPCVSIGGFDTGFNEYNPQDRDNIIVSLTVNSLDPQWFFCKQDRPFAHCHAGMVFALNPGDQMGTFLRNARRDNGNLDKDPVSTGQLTSTHTKGSGTASPILSSPTPPLLGPGPASVTPGSVFTSGSTSSYATPGPVFTSGSTSTLQHSYASAAALVTPVVVTLPGGLLFRGKCFNTFSSCC
ncbi:cupredoxin domain-containing protein [Aspergillus undulatus]|uniref:cupredoxin domain-containing protein n=1 Tax=Aspergillus undulatus TaxID=1810928 RepID=UPI003CCD3964